jgi:hypothetical protein
MDYLYQTCLNWAACHSKMNARVGAMSHVLLRIYCVLASIKQQQTFRVNLKGFAINHKVKIPRSGSQATISQNRKFWR